MRCKCAKLYKLLILILVPATWYQLLYTPRPQVFETIFKPKIEEINKIKKNKRQKSEGSLKR